MNEKDEIALAMKNIASRKAGKTKLVFNKETKTIWKVNGNGEYLEDTGMGVQDT